MRSELFGEEMVTSEDHVSGMTVFMCADTLYVPVCSRDLDYLMGLRNCQRRQIDLMMVTELLKRLKR